MGQEHYVFKHEELGLYTGSRCSEFDRESGRLIRQRVPCSKGSVLAYVLDSERHGRPIHLKYLKLT